MLEGSTVTFLTWIPCSLEGGSTNFSPFSWDKLFVQNVTSTLSLSPFSFWNGHNLSLTKQQNTTNCSIWWKFRPKIQHYPGLIESCNRYFICKSNFTNISNKRNIQDIEIEKSQPSHPSPLLHNINTNADAKLNFFSKVTPTALLINFWKSYEIVNLITI